MSGAAAFLSIDPTPILLTLRLAAATLVVLMVIGLPMAWWLATTPSRWRSVVEAAAALPLVLPPTVLGFYLLLLLGRGGALGEIWRALFGHTLAFSFPGLLVASCVYSLPFVVQPLQAGFETIDRRVIEASRSLGAGRVKTFVRVILPRIRMSLIVAGVLGFAHTVGEFGVVLMVGGNIPGRTQVVSIAIYEHVESLEYAAAHGLSLLLVAFSFVGLWVVYGTHGRGRERARP
ncbi:MAG: molybdate ABC transporter permease subunit [Rhodobacterales bacterium]|nr:molybdate ABC transporter permease subunit [Rhodobacterales bacterium]